MNDLESDDEQVMKHVDSSAPPLEETEWILLPACVADSHGLWPGFKVAMEFAHDHPALALGSAAMVLTAVTIQPLLLLTCVRMFPMGSSRR